MSTTYLATTNYQSLSTAAIRSWAGQVEATFSSGGWTQTADTGQTAANALPLQSTANAVSGYQIWKMADALAGTYPCFIKIEYGSGAGTSGGNAGVWITIGTGSDGAGNITGVLQTRLAVHSGSVSVGGTSNPYWGSASTSRIAFFMSCQNSTFPMLFSIERSKDAAGADTGDGFLALIGDTTGSAAAVWVLFRYLRPSGNTLGNSTVIGAFVPSGTTWADSGSVFGVCPLRYFNGQPSNPGLNWAVYFNGDTAAGSSVSLSIYGASHTYMPMGSTYLGTVIAGAATSTLMMLWE